MPDSGANLDRTFGALADGTRRAILLRLASGETSVSELAQPFAMSLPAVSKHLAVLENAGLVVRMRDGRVRRCRMEAGPIREGEAWIVKLRRFWEGQFDALERYLARTAPKPAKKPKPKGGAR
ncbi:MAG TPA: metalloregulator ArsR/SmtB family transcription factor [Candidatus Cybelea sp.]|nr:metalloregulator ArsR/SmtB family transcription factor [Candidatus Cybelea sp.]